MDIETFNYIDNLISKYKDTWKDFEFVSLTELNNNIPDDSEEINFSKLLKKMKGIFPVELYNLIKEYKPALKLTFEDEEHSTKRYENNGWHKIAEEINLPTPHLANYEWRYTEESANKIVDYILNTENKKINICCLGTPTIALELINRGHFVTLLDINNPLIDCIKKIYDETKIECITYDAQKNIPQRLINKFDIILINPPWYLDYYELFISRALQLMKEEGGEIILPFFQPLSRHTALQDLLCLEKYIEEPICNKISSLGYIEFETPTFEKRILQKNGISICDNWRNAEIVKLTYDKNMIIPIQEEKILEKKNWVRFYDEKTKSYFVIDALNMINKDFQLESAQSSFLENISRKEIENLKIDIWDNRNKIIFFN